MVVTYRRWQRTAGTALSFEPGLLWATFMEHAGLAAPLEPPLPPGPRGRGGPGVADPPGLDARPVPNLVPPDLPIRAAAAPRISVGLTFWILSLGALVLFPSLIYLFRVFEPAPR